MDPLSGDFADLSVRDPTASLLTRVSPERDTLNDEDHKKLDAKVEEAFSLNREFNRDPEWRRFLSIITFDDKRLMSVSTEDAEGLLETHPSIKDVLQAAWKEGAYKRVRQLSILWPVLPETLNRHRRPINENIDLTNKALESAWRDDYLGDNHRLLLANINRAPRSEKPYSNQIAIVQSSGTGKSRMVHEQAKLVFTIPFNLRDAADNRDLAFPSPDNAVRDHLVTTSLSDNEYILKANYLKFFGGVFKRVDDELAKNEQALRRRRIRTAEDLAKWWSSHLEERRTGLYKEAIDDAGRDIGILPHIQKKHDEELLARRRESSEGPGDTESSKGSDPTIIEFAAAEAARAALEGLMTRLNGLEGSGEIKLVIYFDEAHPLNILPKKDNEKTLYDILCSCLNQFLSSPIFFIFLSTNSSLAQFAPPRALAKSARIRRGLAETHAPITETPFDCCGDLQVKPGKLRMKDISTIPFMARFGRPLFWTLLRGAGVKAPELHTELLDLARAKLVASHNIDSTYDSIEPLARLAVLDVQLSLDFEPRREKVETEATLVESHMRFVYSIPEHREYLRSGYPSEPLLAEAAARQLRKWRDQNKYVVIDTLTNILKTGLLDRGELGELTGRHLLLDAYHRAVDQEHEVRHQTPVNYSAGCRLESFIKMLYKEDYAEMVLNSTPDNMKGLSFREVFKDSIVCFTHFGKMADDTGVTSTATWAAFIRHMAIMCRNGQHTVDCIIPVLLKDTPLCEHAMTGILVQFKRQIQSGTVVQLTIDAKKLNFFPNLEQCTHGQGPATRKQTKHFYRPYVSLIMELGVQPKINKDAQTLTIYNPERSSKREPDVRPKTPPPKEGGANQGTPSRMHIPIAGEHHHGAVGHPRYNIFAYGCSPTVYLGIDDAHKGWYGLLLSCRNFLGEHPRQDPETLRAVRRMKPFWNGGEDCYHWVQHDNVLHGPVPPDVEFSVGGMSNLNK